MGTRLIYFSGSYGVFGLALTPTRELAFQIGEQFNALGSR
jgi:superfamily II DNA/RNA helicase